MPLFTKPQFNTVWASRGAKLAPDVAKINQGWVVEIPPHEYANWLENRRDAMLAHLNQAGVPVWDSTAEYQTNKSYVQGASTGVVYKCLITNTGVNPELDIQGNWEVAFQRSGEALLKSQNLADVPNKAQARTNLGIATTSDYDNRYLVKSQNLADVPNKATARNNLDTFSKQEVLDLLTNAQQAGEVAPFAMTSAPAGWLVCNGAAVSRTAYPRLFAAIGTTFGTGNGSTTFNVPDLRGEFIRGWDNGRGKDAGRVIGSWQEDAFKSHTHDLPRHLGGSQDMMALYSTDGVDEGISPLSKTGITGGTETRPRNVALLYCIRT